MVINDVEYAWRIEDGFSPLQLFPYYHEEADSRIVLDLSKSCRNIIIVEKDTDILLLLIYSYSMCAVSQVWVLKNDTHSYFDIGTISSTWRTLSVEIYCRTMRLQDVIQLQYSTELEKLTHLKGSLKIKLFRFNSMLRQNISLSVMQMVKIV